MKLSNIKLLGRYFNVQKLAGMFFILLILTAYQISFKQSNPLDIHKQNIINMVKSHQDNGITTLAITSLPFWLSLRDKLSNEEN